MIGIKVKTLLERDLYLDIPEDLNESEVIERAKNEIVLPINAMNMANNTLRNLRINIPNIDLSDWATSNVSYELIK